MEDLPDLSPEAILAQVLNLDPDALEAGTGKGGLYDLFEQGPLVLSGLEPLNEECRQRGRRRRPTRKQRAEAAKAVRVLRALPRQADEDVRNGELRVTLEEKLVLDKLLARPVIWEAALQFSKADLPDVGDAECPMALGGAAPLPVDENGRQRVFLGPQQKGRVRSLFGFFLRSAAVTLAEMIYSGQGKRIGFCQAPLAPFDLSDKRICGGFFVGDHRGQTKEYCSQNCRQRASRRFRKQHAYRPGRKAK